MGMRIIALLTLLAFVPMAHASGVPVDVVVDPEASVDEDGVHASLYVAQSQERSCNDCGGLVTSVAVDSDGRETTASAQVCRTGFVYFCVVDEEITL